MKKILSVIMIAVLTISIVACGSSSKALVGRWEYNSSQSKWSKGDVRLSELEFFSDGTYSSNIDGYSGTYTIENNRLRLSISGYSRKDMIRSYSFDQGKLILDDDQGYDHWVYDRLN